MKYLHYGLRSHVPAVVLSIGLLVAGLMTLVMVPTSTAQGTDAVTFTLINGTDATIMEFYAAPPSSQEWEEDILGEDVLEPGESVNITIDDWREDCHYDFLAVFEDESELMHENISICGGEEYTYQ
jgi:hypothetical protein